ncbi:MAG: ZIP family metal transporter, partial [Clostridia bacterium]|nr:ZIP family metal transporter [Clostridia bacterium]
MQIALLTALGVGGASVIGALLGFIFRRMTHKFSDIVLSFAAGVMLSAAIIGLILPSLEHGGKYPLLVTVIGIFAGALTVNVLDKIVPHLHKLAGADQESHPHGGENLSRVLLFV